MTPLEDAILQALEVYRLPGEPNQFFGAVGRAADHAIAIEDPEALPAAYVVLSEISHGDQEVMGGHVAQQQWETIAVITATGNTIHAKGEHAATDLRGALRALDDAIYGITIPGYSPLEKAGSMLIGYNQGILWWQSHFRAHTQTSNQTFPWGGN